MKEGFRSRYRLQGQAIAARLRREIWIALGGLVLLVALWLAWEPLSDLSHWGEVARIWVQSFGPFAPLAYIALFIAQILLAPIPGTAVTLLGGYLFGSMWGFWYSVIGLMLGAALAAGIARYLGRPTILRLVGEEQMQQWERQLRVHSPVTWTIVFFFPVPDALYYVAGLSGVSLRRLLLAVLIGRVPMMLAANWLGAQAVELSLLPLLSLLVLFAAVTIFVYRHKRRLRWLALMALRRGRRIVHRRMIR